MLFLTVVNDFVCLARLKVSLTCKLSITPIQTPNLALITYPNPYPNVSVESMIRNASLNSCTIIVGCLEIRWRRWSSNAYKKRFSIEKITVIELENFWHVWAVIIFVINIFKSTVTLEIVIAFENGLSRLGNLIFIGWTQILKKMMA